MKRGVNGMEEVIGESRNSVIKPGAKGKLLSSSPCDENDTIPTEEVKNGNNSSVFASY